MLPEILENPALTYAQEEAIANNIVRSLAAQPKMSYKMAYDIIKAHKTVFEEALSHLNHNAAIEKEKDPLVYVLD